MIMDTLANWRLYTWPNDRYCAGFEHLESLAADAPDGKTLLQGDDLFCMVQAYETTSEQGHEFEAHREFADIQILLSGEEEIYWAPRTALTVTKPYVHDIEFQALVPEPTRLVLLPGLFCVFLPDDAHAPCIAHVAPGPVRKAVVKVRL